MSSPAPAVIALDFDQTLAPTYAAIVPVWDDFMAAWLVTHGIYKTEEAARATYQFENEYGCGPTYFAKKFGKDVAWVNAFYQAITPRLLKAALGGTQADAHLRSQLLELRSHGHRLAVISQGHRDYLLPLLEHLNLADLFPPHMVVDRAHKRFSADGYRQLQYLTTVHQPKAYLMADDSAENLSHAKKCGYFTAHIHPQKPASLHPDADAHFPTVSEYLDFLLATL